MSHFDWMSKADDSDRDAEPLPHQPCELCGGVGLINALTLDGVLEEITCPACEGSGWDSDSSGGTQ